MLELEMWGRATENCSCDYLNLLIHKKGKKSCTHMICGYLVAVNMQLISTALSHVWVMGFPHDLFRNCFVLVYTSKFFCVSQFHHDLLSNGTGNSSRKKASCVCSHRPLRVSYYSKHVNCMMKFAYDHEDPLSLVKLVVQSLVESG